MTRDIGRKAVLSDVKTAFTCFQLRSLNLGPPLSDHNHFIAKSLTFSCFQPPISLHLIDKYGAEIGQYHVLKHYHIFWVAQEMGISHWEVLAFS